MNLWKEHSIPTSHVPKLFLVTYILVPVGGSGWCEIASVPMGLAGTARFHYRVLRRHRNNAAGLRPPPGGLIKPSWSNSPTVRIYV